MTIGERIRNRRIELGFSADYIADKLGKDRATVYRYESNDIKKFPTTVLENLAKLLEVTPAYLMGWEKEQNINSLKVFSDINKLAPKEQKLISAYRAHPEMHEAVHRILGIAEAEPNYRLVAFGGDNENKKRKSEPHIT